MVKGQPTTFSPYNRGWQDAIQQVKKILDKELADSQSGSVSNPLGWHPLELDEGHWADGCVLPEETGDPADFQEYEVTFQGERICDIRRYKFGRGHWWHGSEIVDEYIVAWRDPSMPYCQPESH